MKNDQQSSRRQFAVSSIAGALSANLLAGATSSETPIDQEPATTPKDENAKFVSDLSRCEPKSALTRSFEPGRWQLIDYETEEGVKGVMASAKPEHSCGELRLPLDAKGLHKVYIGVNYTKAAYTEWSVYGALDVKLSGDDGFQRLGAEAGALTEDGKDKFGINNDIFKSIHETYWRTVDLTGQALIFRQLQAPYNRPELANISNLSYVKLVPVSQEEKQRWQPTPATGKVAILFCTGQFSGHTGGTPTYHPTSEQWFKDELAPYTQSDIKLFVFEAMRGNYCLYRTRIGDVGNEENRWEDSWVDPLAAFTKLAHQHEMKIFASLRMIGPQFPMNREPIARARHYWKHPEWAKRDREGLPISNWSVAFPEVRKYWLSLLRETLDYGTDGIQLHLNRSEPLVYFEEPVVKAFQQRYGEDPRKLAESDPRWQTHCAGYVTQFLREVRSLLDEKPGRELGVTIYGEASKYDHEPNFTPLRYNCDVDTWLKERLVNYVMPSPKIDASFLKRWRAAAGDSVHLWPDLMPRTQPADAYARLAKKYRDAGADGFCLWDGERRESRMSEWAAVRRLGHTQQLDQLAAEGRFYYRRVPLKIIGGFSARHSFLDG